MKLHEWNARLHGLVIFRSLLERPRGWPDLPALIDCLDGRKQQHGSACATPWPSLKAVLFERTTRLGHRT